MELDEVCEHGVSLVDVACADDVYMYDGVANG